VIAEPVAALQRCLVHLPVATAEPGLDREVLAGAEHVAIDEPRAAADPEPAVERRGRDQADRAGIIEEHPIVQRIEVVAIIGPRGELEWREHRRLTAHRPGAQDRRHVQPPRNRCARQDGGHGSAGQRHLADRAGMRLRLGRGLRSRIA
jgi:hypothetical protein